MTMETMAAPLPEVIPIIISRKKNMLRHAGASDTFVWPSFLDILSAIQLAVVGY